jgi:hypothetical protein
VYGVNTDSMHLVFKHRLLNVIKERRLNPWKNSSGDDFAIKSLHGFTQTKILGYLCIHAAKTHPFEIGQ